MLLFPNWFGRGMPDCKRTRNVSDAFCGFKKFALEILPKLMDHLVANAGTYQHDFNFLFEVWNVSVGRYICESGYSDSFATLQMNGLLLI